VALAVAALVAVTGALAGAGPAAAIVTGLGEQNAGFFADPSFQELRIDHVRVVVPWDAALTDDARTRTWLEQALGHGLVPLVAFEKSRGVVCPGTSCESPSPAEYEAAVAAFRARWPQVTELTPWNEPNHRSQPTFTHPQLAAAYYEAARRACPQCTLVAGDLLDDANLATWLASYRQGLTEQPAVWGLHNYYDATYFVSTGLDALAAITTGEIWLSETGGIVRFSPAAGGGGLPYDEQRAADSIRWLYAMTSTRPRAGRMYLYHWRAVPNADFDGGLVGPDGEPRPGLAVVREHVGVRGAAGAGAGGTTSEPGAPRSGATGSGSARGSKVVLRLSGDALRLVKRGLRVGVACVSAPARCTGRLVVTIPRSARASSRPRLVMNFDLRPGRSIVRELRASARTREALIRQRRLQATYCLGGSGACRTVRRALVVRTER
jgi:hypothetical protein